MSYVLDDELAVSRRTFRRGPAVRAGLIPGLPGWTEPEARSMLPCRRRAGS
jgi:hypothetical protein